MWDPSRAPRHPLKYGTNFLLVHLRKINSGKEESSGGSQTYVQYTFLDVSALRIRCMDLSIH